MQRRSAMVLAAALGAGIWGPQAAAQAAFPNQPVRIISPFPAGSGPDVVARMVGERLASAWKQPVVIDARPGANGFIAAGAVKQAAATGHELLLGDLGLLAISPSLFKSLPYDAKADFVPVGGVYRTSFFIVVGANSPIRSVKDLAAAATAAPGKISYASNAVGSPLHLGAAQVEAVTNTKMLHVPYKDIAQMYVAVSAGEVDWAMASLASAGPLLKAGKLRLVAVADNARSPLYPNVPTFEEAGGPKSVVVRSWIALLAPRGTPPATVAALNRSLNEVLAQAELQEKFSGFGFAPYPTTPSAFAGVIESESVFYAEMVRRTGASAE